MNTKFTIVQQYKKYCNAVLSNDGRGIPSLFKKFDDFLEKEFQDGMDFELWYLMKRRSINFTLHQIFEKQVFLNKLTLDWDTSAVQECYKLIGILKRCDESDDENSWRICFARLAKLFQDTEDPCTKLYLYNCYYQTIEGKKFFNDGKKKFNSILKAQSEEEIEELLKKPNVERKQLASERFACLVDMPKEELFKLFTPTSMEEQEEMYDKLEEMATNGEISYNDYTYVKDILLGKTKQYFSTHQGNVTEPFKLQVYDGEKMLQELDEEEAEKPIEFESKKAKSAFYEALFAETNRILNI